MLSVDPKEKNSAEHYLLTVSAKGYVKRSALLDYVSSRSNIVGFQCKPGDYIIGAVVVKETDNILLTTNDGFTNHFSIAEIPVQGRKSSGVIGIKVGTNQIVGFSVYSSSQLNNSNLAVFTANGMAKMSSLTEYPITKKGGKGVKTAILDVSGGNIINTTILDEANIKQGTVLLASTKGFIARIKTSDLVKVSRAAKPVKCVVPAKNDDIISVCIENQL